MSNYQLALVKTKRLQPQSFLTRLKKPISIRFQIRSPEPKKPKDEPRHLHIRISVDGIEDSGFAVRHHHDMGYLYGEIITLKAPVGPKPQSGDWVQAEQKVQGRDGTINDRLAEIKADVIRVYKEQMRRFADRTGPKPTPLTVKLEFATGEIPRLNKTAVRKGRLQPIVLDKNITLIDAYEVYVTHLRATNLTGAIASATMEKWDHGFNYLTKYEPGNLKASAVTRGWAKEYHAWLMGTGPMSADSATRYVKRISAALDHLYNEDIIDGNRLHDISLPRDPSKDVHFLSKEQLERFWALELSDTGGVCLWWLKLMTLTGMDYPDAQRYVADRTLFDQDGRGGRKIIINRSKEPFNESRIPILPRLDKLMQCIPAETVSADTINEYTREIAPLIGFPHRMVIKTCRKTCGAMFLWLGYPIPAISRILGHSSTEMTEKHYVKITADYLDYEMERVNKQPQG